MKNKNIATLSALVGLMALTSCDPLELDKKPEGAAATPPATTATAAHPCGSANPSPDSCASTRGRRPDPSADACASPRRCCNPSTNDCACRCTRSCWWGNHHQPRVPETDVHRHSSAC